MSECVLTETRTERVTDYFRRQYEFQDRSTEENMRAIFSEDLVYHVGDDVVSLADLAATVDKIRRSPDSVRSVVVSDFREEGDRLFFHMSLRALDPDTGKRVEMDGDHEWRFDESEKVVEVWPQDRITAARFFEALSADAG
jgi:hypothetical protein